MTDIIGTPGDDHLVGSGRFDLSQGGEDYAKGGGGADIFYMGAAFDSGDSINGVGGDDILELDGDYSAGVAFSPSRNFSINTIQLDGGHDYNITIASQYVVGLSYDASRLQAGDHAIIDSGHAGSINASTIFYGGAGTDWFTADVHGRFYMGAGLQADDRLFGGKGADGVRLEGDYSAGLVLDPDTLKRVGFLSLVGAYEYRITLASNDDGKNFSVGGGADPGQVVILDGSATKHGLWATGSYGTDTLIGGHGADHLDGSQGDDKLLGGALGDTLTGGIGSDRFFYLSTDESTAGASDLITDLDNSDVVYLKPIDADINAKGQQAFHLVAAFGHHAGELVVSYDSGSNLTTISGDVNGDGAADLVIHATGDHHDFTNFVL